MKKSYLYIGGAVLGLIILAVVGYMVFAGNSEEPVAEEPTTKKRKITAPVNVIDKAERPYLLLSPNSKSEIKLTVSEVYKEAEEMEYEIEYQSGSLLQGVFGALDLTTMPVSEDILLGSCSAGGACTYHEDVQGGTILTQYAGPEDYALKSDWKFYETTADLTEVTSRDEEYILESEDVSSMGTAIVFNNAGVPEGLEGTWVSDPLTISYTARTTLGEATVTLPVSQAGDIVIMGWDGSAWTEMETTVTGNTASATGDMMETYIAVTK